MDSIKRLEENCKQVLKDLREVEGRASVYVNDIEALKARKTLIEKEIAELDLQKKSIAQDVADERKAEISRIEDKMKSLVIKETLLEQSIAGADRKSQELENQRGKFLVATDEAETSKANYDKARAEYEAKMEKFNQAAALMK